MTHTEDVFRDPTGVANDPACNACEVNVSMHTEGPHAGLCNACKRAGVSA